MITREAIRSFALRTSAGLPPSVVHLRDPLGRRWHNPRAWWCGRRLPWGFRGTTRTFVWKDAALPPSGVQAVDDSIHVRAVSKSSVVAPLVAISSFDPLRAILVPAFV